MKKLLASLATGLLIGSPLSAVAIESEELRSYRSMDSLGCMLLKECTDDTVRINSVTDLEKHYGTTYDTGVRSEINDIIVTLNELGVEVWLGPEKYFPNLHRGVYTPGDNYLFLNDSYAADATQLTVVLRHEGWHAAQDCMAGSLDNRFIGVIYNEEEVPQFWQDYAIRAYGEGNPVLPWEKEAVWMGHTQDGTREALKVCAAGPMWESYTPTPMTQEWLEREGYLK